MPHTQARTGRIRVMEALDTQPMGAITALPAIMLPLKEAATQARVIRDKDTRVRAIEDRHSDLSLWAGVGPYPLNGIGRKRQSGGTWHAGSQSTHRRERSIG